MEIKEIIIAIQAQSIEISRHSLEEAKKDALTIEAINLSVIETGEIIEDYPDAYPYPACLVLSRNQAGEPIHSVWGYNQNTDSAKLITVYRPDPERWIDWRIRK